ncbi:MAG TPA: hypothetical protein VFN35_11320 [Ktedonobacteraceae bacterium]|nr:hypothetical protein [Ktedonobacteraceae bacterium]
MVKRLNLTTTVGTLPFEVIERGNKLPKSKCRWEFLLVGHHHCSIIEKPDPFTVSIAIGTNGDMGGTSFIFAVASVAKMANIRISNCVSILNMLHTLSE